MSYILDALRKADAQRESDPARGIHAQPAVATATRTTSGTAPWVWAGAALCGAAVVAYAAWPAAQPPAPAEPVAAMEPAPAPAVVPVSTQVSPPAPPPLPTPVVARPAPQPEPAAPVAVAAPAPEPARILALAELPAAVRSELPKLAISGGVHSENAAQRMLIVGGQVVNEGAELAPGVVLEQIRPRTAVLRYKDYRYSVSY